MEIKQIPLSSVIPSPMNPRKTFDKDDLQELADNIEKQGLLQPITVRPIRHPANEFGDRPDKYEIICGERRYRACISLYDKYVAEHGGEPDERISNIAAIVREMTDDEAFDAMITENLQRKDVDPMEEAFAFAQLQKKGRSIHDIALRFGKSVRFVQDRIKLNALIPELMKVLKEDRMPISAAMLICKVTEDQQRMYYKQYNDNYQGFTTATASGFVKGLFLNITDAVWKDAPEYAVGCGTSCGECPLNTCNHGCLFYEMKAKDGQCTCEEKFISKTVAFVGDYLRSIDDKLVKSGQPLEKGKAVVALEDYSYSPGSVKKIKDAVRAKVESLGYEIVAPYSYFRSRCGYSIDDERTQAFLESGECYRVIQLSSFNYIRIEQQAWYLNKSDTTTNVDSNGKPLEVQELLNKYKQEKDLLPYSHIVNGCKALGEHGEFKDLNGLDNAEFILAYSMMIDNNRELCAELGLGDFPKAEEITAYVSEHFEMAPYILRSWIKHALRVGTNILTLDEMRHLSKPFINRLGDLWCAAEYRDAIEKVNKKFSKSEKKIASQLKALGYTLECEKITDTVPAEETN